MNKCLYPHTPEELPIPSMEKFRSRFQLSQNFPGMVKGVDPEEPIWIIVHYSFRLKKWLDLDGCQVTLISWFSTHRNESGRLIHAGQSTIASQPKARTYKHWTKKEEDFVAKNYILMSNKKLAEALDRTIDSVSVKLSELELYRPGNHRRLRKEAPHG